jgi:branched-chain amino acid transport system substrate-binding protein
MIRLLLAALVLLSVQPAMAADPQPYTIDVVVGLTGIGAFAGKLATQALTAYEGIVNKSGGIHGRPLHFEIHDDATNPINDVQIVNQILTTHPAVILGALNTASCEAVAPLMLKGPVYYCLSPGISPPAGSYVFASATTLVSSMTSLYDHLRDMGFKRAASITGTDAIGVLNEQVTKSYFGSPRHRAMELVADEVFNPADQTVAAEVSRLKAASPDLVLNWANGTPFGTTLRDLTNVGMGDIRMMMSPVNANPTLLTQFTTFMPKTVVTIGLPYQGHALIKPLQGVATEYLTAIKDAGFEPSPTHMYAWDAARVVVAALRALPADATATQLHDYIEKLHDFPALCGMYDFRSGDQHGCDGSQETVVRWDPATKDFDYYQPGK